MKDNLDYLRVLLMAEPRGHFDMYGALLVEKDEAEEEGKEDDADLAVLFMHNEGVSVTVCVCVFLNQLRKRISELSLCIQLVIF